MKALWMVAAAASVLFAGGCNLFTGPESSPFEVALEAESYAPGATVNAEITNLTAKTWFYGPSICSNFDRRVDGKWVAVPTGYCEPRLVEEFDAGDAHWTYLPLEIAPGATVTVSDVLPLDAVEGTYRRRMGLTDKSLSNSFRTLYSAPFQVQVVSLGTSQP